MRTAGPSASWRTIFTSTPVISLTLACRNFAARATSWLRTSATIGNAALPFSIQTISPELVSTLFSGVRSGAVMFAANAAASNTMCVI